jgi:cobyrinic acid a,c-diamide synthase
VVIAGLRGGSGKTTFSLGLLSLLRGKGYSIIPFKKGPDYIDAGWLARAAGHDCHNLDAFLFPEEIILSSFVTNTAGADGAVIEGNRGIFDGMDEKGTFSTARLSKILSSPVILVVDCTKVTTTIAAILKGVASFDRDLNLGGVVLNQLAGKRHESVIRKAIEEHTDIRVIGAISKMSQDILPERHMGLVPFQESGEVDGILERIRDHIGQYVDFNEVLRIMESAPSLEVVASGQNVAPLRTGVRIGVLRDAAFQFYYPENLAMLREKGADVIEINALRQEKLPELDALYIGGGFPETQAISLSGNSSLLQDIKDRAEGGLPVYAECGGLMFLGRQIEVGGRVMKMVGLLPVDFSMQQKPVAHGYTIVEVAGDNPYYEPGTELRGHEFHYSAVTALGEGVKFAFRMKRGKGIRDGCDGLVYKNVLAAYTHFHALGSPQWADAMVSIARRRRESAQSQGGGRNS